MVNGRIEKTRIYITTHVSKLKNGNFRGYVLRRVVLNGRATQHRFYCIIEHNSVTSALKDAEKLACGNGETSPR